MKKYREAASDEERAERERTDPCRLFESRFLELVRAYAGQPAAMEAVQWLAKRANPGPAFDEGLSLIEQHHLEDEGIQKMCRTLVFRRTPGIERFLLAVAKGNVLLLRQGFVARRRTGLGEGVTDGCIRHGVDQDVVALVADQGPERAESSAPSVGSRC